MSGRRVIAFRVLLALCATTTAGAQLRGTGDEPVARSLRPVLLGAHVSHHWLDLAENQPRLEATGYGVRLMVNGQSVGRMLWIGRLGLGGFLVHTPERSGVETLQYGAQLDVTPLLTPIGGVIDPLFSLGIGAIRIDPSSPDPALGLTRRTTDLTLVPDFGAYLHVTPALSVRADVRDVIRVSEIRTTQNLEVQVGVALGF